MNFDYSQIGYAVRDDIPDAHRSIWRMIGEPGAWWRGVDRIAFVQESRNARTCEACRKRRKALSPQTDCGPHNRTTHLSDVVVDTVHRITTDPSRLSESWLDGINAQGVSNEMYVEILGVVVAAISIDGFHRALGLPLEPLPEPMPGDPNGYRPKGVGKSGAWVEVVHPGSVGEREADLYPDGQAGNVLSAMSLVPDSVRMLLRLGDAQYLPIRRIRTPGDNANRNLSRCQMELLAARVSSLSDCFY